ncbi:MAG TPA: permease [Nocardioidaceae bacterium]|nr:permease [Nocardioidaceae bacterium]
MASEVSDHEAGCRPDATPGRRVARREVVGFAVFVAVLLAMLTWAKWWPYSLKVPLVADTRTLGDSIITGSDTAPPGVSLAAGLEFAQTYLLAIWPAMVAGLAIAAGVSVLVPRDWLRRAAGRPGAKATLRGGVMSVPPLMCTCCTAPVAVGLRQRGASVGASMAFFLGNPALNPVVVVLAFFVLGWQWALLRAAVGVALIALVTLLVGTRSVPTRQRALAPPAEAAGEETGPLPLQLLRSFARLALRLLPEYVLLVVALGALRGLLFGEAISLHGGLLAVVLFAVAGAVLPIPTAGEIPVVAALLVLGVSAPAAAALLITLPAISLPSALMVRRAFPARTLWTAGGSVVAVGFFSAGVAAAVGL